MNNKLSVKVKYFGGVTNNPVSGDISNIAAIRAVPNLTDLMGKQNDGENGRDDRERNDSKDNKVVLYNIQHNFLSEFAAREEEAVAELKQNGVIAFIDAKHETVSIDKAEDVFARLVPDTPNSSEAVDSVDAIDPDENASITTDNDGDAFGIDTVDAADTADSYEASIGNDDTTVDEEIDESEDNAEIEDNEIADEGIADTIAEMATEADTAEIHEDVEADEADEVAIDNNWDSAVVILTGCGNSHDELNTRLSQLLYYKTLEAGRYDVRLLEEEDSAPDLHNSSAETVPSSIEASVADEAVGNGDSDDDNDSNGVDAVDAADTINTAETVADSQESAESATETTLETASDTATTTDTISEDALSRDAISEYEIEATEIAVNFIIREIFHQYVFVVPSLLHNDPNAPFAASAEKAEKKEAMRGLANKPLYLLNPHKNVEATGIMRGDGKRIVVKAGSTISGDNRLPNQKGQTSSANLRQKLIDDGIIVDDCFVTDYEFNSTSAAASVILGQSASGMNTWKDESGRKLESLLGR